ncbi:restriction endonuclease subunit S [Methylicorpusculum oleiharenae]|uniref:restriction endonuclease subunit S n=1 Tax=Methylicorpusculum oleiharenae TaxID=1338687 RepID=UPI00135B0B85|nr:restriction endonuclease subunit S [Methylicorpusculum oleiharenae]MCD2452245.1 restriction endonuclease subunit S [Methylicorpusculum oleiharenae]
MKWPEVPIKDVCLLAVDCVNKTAHVVDYETPYRMLRTTNVRGGFVDAENTRFVTEETFLKWTRRGIPQKGDVILTREAPLGDIGRLTSDNTVFLGQRLFMYRADPERLNSEYLAYVLQSPLVQGRIKSKGFGATVEHARVGDCENLLIPVPDLRIQERIGETLSAYDDLIENNKRRIKLLEESARQLYKEWFVRFRFPGHEHVKIIDGVPEGWKKKPLRKLLTLNYGKALKAEYRIPGNIPVYGSSGVVGTHNKPLVKGPGMIVGRKGNVGSIFWSHLDFFPIDTVYFVSADESNYFIYYALLHTVFISTDVAVPGLNRDFAYSKEILIPTETLISDFEESVAPIFKQCDVLSRYNEPLAKARDLLLPKLMSGEIAV